MAQEAWSHAHEAARAAGVELRPLARLEDGDRILRVMVATWGEHQLIPREMLRALGDSANPPYGAFVGDELIGYVLGWIARDPQDGLVVHSHMLATLPDRRHKGVGYALKLAQGAQALEAGVGVVRWTFDPVIARNAWLNLSKLRAVADRFERDYYGPMEDLVNRGERTDRLVVRWDLRNAREEVEAQDAPVLLEALDDTPTPTGTPVPARGPVLIRIPRDHERLRAERPELARAWRDPVAEAIEACVASGRIARGFTPDAAYVFA
ncbi:MAG TPA: GNAT family N-acetyltransferase [Actinomycetota bacterium]|nr:GNAT family N-acetyltransferase [Actinomycetota bacterium]